VGAPPFWELQRAMRALGRWPVPLGSKRLGWKRRRFHLPCASDPIAELVVFAEGLSAQAGGLQRAGAATRGQQGTNGGWVGVWLQEWTVRARSVEGSGE
jgi:hypothetical protein